MKLNSFPHYLQLDAMDCGPSCLRMIAKYYGKSYSLQTLRARSFITREGVSMLGISDAAIDRFPYFGGAHLFRATEEGCTVALHSALEPESLRGLL